MVLRKALFKALFLSLLVLPFSLWAETADEYAHRGAQKYIFGDMAAAKSEVAKGLAKFPRDKELQEMVKLFQDRKGGGGKSKEQQQQQQQQNEGSKDQQNSNQQPQNNQNNSGKDQKQAQQKSQNSGQSPSPSPSPDENSPKQDQKGEGEQSPSPGPGSTPPAATPSPSPGGGEGSEPSATPSESPEKRIAGQLKEASEPDSRKQDKTGEIADAEAEKEGKMSERQALALLQSMKDEEARVRLDERRAARHVYKDW